MKVDAFVTLFLAQLAGYFIGGIPFAFLVTWLKTGRDIRTIGSGNVGATNVGRLLGLPYFFLVFLLDFAKGAGPVLIAQYFARQGTLPAAEFLPAVVGFTAILGHLFPIYLGMKGGKGVATAIGVLLCLTPWATLVGLATWILIVLLTRMISLGSMAFAIAFAVAHLVMTPTPWVREQWPLTLLVIVLALLILIKHRANFARILAGTEPKISLGKKKVETDTTPRP
ncbi:glycerol-3-phosphate 1-O-acyltransferase PlsY [bacterium]|nr:glycerol-3-phosphate 1-O-acyltransferase PlsY [bacterium]